MTEPWNNGNDQSASQKTSNREATRILKRVYSKLKTGSPHSGLSGARILTGLDYGVIALLEHTSITPTKIEPDRAEILKILINYIIEKKVLLTTTQLFALCKGNLPNYMDIGGFRKLLFKYDFVWKNQGNSFVVLERPEVTYERYRYLKTLTEYFDDVYFVEENAYQKFDHRLYYDYFDSLQEQMETIKVTYAVSNKKIIFGDVNEGPYTKETFKNWILGDLIPNLEKPSVIVFSSADHHCETIPEHTDLTIESLRYEMTDLLDKNNIPYDESMSKVELFSLIEQYTDVDGNKYIVDNAILSRGHIPVRIPDHLISLTPGIFVYNAIKTVMTSKNKVINPKFNISSVLSTISPENLKTWFETIFGQYKKMLDDDLQVDQCLDDLIMKLSTKTPSVPYGDSDVPSLSEDSD